MVKAKAVHGRGCPTGLDIRKWVDEFFKKPKSHDFVPLTKGLGCLVCPFEEDSSVAFPSGGHSPRVADRPVPEDDGDTEGI